MEETKQLTDKTPAQIENEAIEGNEIIAAWLGWIRREPGEYNLPTWWEPDRNDLRLNGKFRGYPHQLRFHSSWDVLLPCIVYARELIKCAGWGTPTEQEAKSRLKAVTNEVCNVNIENAHYCLVKFIKWYSNQPQKAS